MAKRLGIRLHAELSKSLWHIYICDIGIKIIYVKYTIIRQNVWNTKIYSTWIYFSWINKNKKIKSNEVEVYIITILSNMYSSGYRPEKSRWTTSKKRKTRLSSRKCQFYHLTVFRLLVDAGGGGGQTGQGYIVHRLVHRWLPVMSEISGLAGIIRLPQDKLTGNFNVYSIKLSAFKDIV